MANSDITNLPEMTGDPATGDALAIDDVSEGASTRTKHITIQNLFDKFFSAIGVRATLFVRDDGNVGIGTGLPDFPFQVNKTAVGAVQPIAMFVNSSNNTGTGTEIIWASTTTPADNLNGFVKMRSTRQSDGSCDLTFKVSPGGAVPAVEYVKIVGSTGALEAHEVINTDNIVLKTKVISIGTWNMGTLGTATKSVAHGGLDILKIRAVSVVIRNDAGGTDRTYDITAYNTGADNGTVNAGGWKMEGANIHLQRTPGGDFDSFQFEGTAHTRGWITITYEA